MGQSPNLEPAPDGGRAATAARVRLLMAFARAHTAAEVAAGRVVLENAADDGEE